MSIFFPTYPRFLLNRLLVDYHETLVMKHALGIPNEVQFIELVQKYITVLHENKGCCLSTSIFNSTR